MGHGCPLQNALVPRCRDVRLTLGSSQCRQWHIRVATRAGLACAFTRGLCECGRSRGEGGSVDRLAGQIGKADERKKYEEEHRKQDHRTRFATRDTFVSPNAPAISETIRKMTAYLNMPTLPVAAIRHSQPLLRAFVPVLLHPITLQRRRDRLLPHC